MEYFKVKLTCSCHDSTYGIRGVRPSTLNLGTEWSGHLHAPDVLTRVLTEQKASWVPSQSKRCGSRISNSVCPTRSPVTTSAELQKLIIKWQENEPGNLTNLLAVPYQAFLFMGWTMEYVYRTTWKQKRAFPTFTFDCGMWWNLLHRNQTTPDREWNMVCGIWHRLSTTEGFQLQSIPQMFTSCNITFQILGSQFSYYKSKSLLTNTCARTKFRVWSALPLVL